MICIVNYGMGNLGSIQNMLKRLGAEFVISSDKEIIKQAHQLILPGVGHFSRGMERLNDLGLVEILNESVVIRKTPVLGICLGMQLMGMHSEEGDSLGLGWVNANFVKFDVEKAKYPIKVPCMGWNQIKLLKSSKLIHDMALPRFYFVHSYHAVCFDADDILAETEYGYVYTAAYEKENIFGVQFHPEKSHKYGLKLLHNFITHCV